MNPEEQRIADALIERIQQRRDTIDPELAQRIHQGLRDAPDAFYLLAQAAVAQGLQIDTLQSQAQPVQQGWQGQPSVPPPPHHPGFLESIFGAATSAPQQQNSYGQPPAYGQSAPLGSQPGQSPIPSGPGQPLGSAGYQAVNANLPGANANPGNQPPSGYGQPYPGQPQPYPQAAYPQQSYGGSQYPNQPYSQQGYGPPGAPSGYPPQSVYPQPGYGQPAYPIPANAAAGYVPGGVASGFQQPSGYPVSGGWSQPGGSMLGGVGGMVAGAAAGALAMGAVESVVQGYENHERREEQEARQEHREHDDSWRSDHERGLADTGSGRDDSSFYNPSNDASRSDDSEQSNFADIQSDTSADDDVADSSADVSSSDDASDMGGFSDDNS